MPDYKFFFLNSCYDDENNDLETRLNQMGGNTGHKYTASAICKIFLGCIPSRVDGICNMFSENLDDYPVEVINSNYTHILMIMQDQLRPDISYYENTAKIFSRVNNFLSKITIPIVVFGLGSNACHGSGPTSKVLENFNDILKELHPEQVEFLKILAEKCKCISIRGSYTQKILDDLGIKNYKAVGCPSFYLNNKKIIDNKPLKEVIIAGSIIFDFPKQNWIEYPETLNYSFFLQDLYELDTIKMKKDKFFFLTKVEDINNFFKDKDFVYGGRVHCIIMALNNNVPGVCINPDSRAKEMCELFKIPHIDNYHGRFGNIFELYDLVVKDLIKTDFSKLYPEFIKFANANGLFVIEEAPSTAKVPSKITKVLMA